MKIHIKLASILLIVFATGCSLDEYNPHGVTLDKQTATVDGYNKLINTCYFDLQRSFYGRNLILITEGGTDLWTANQNSNNNQQYMKYGGGGAVPIDMAKDFWNGAYDAINYCNAAIDRIENVKGFSSDATKNAKVAEAHFLRALYYFHLVEQFGPVVLNEHETKEATTEAVRTAPLEVYEKVILPDLRFAAQYLPKTRGTTEIGRPTIKSALGLLARACLQTKEYGSNDYLSEALATAEKLISDAQSGGAAYDAHLYTDFAQNFTPQNNKNNQEALYVVPFSQAYGSTNVYDHNRDFKRFYCSPIAFGAVELQGHQLEVGRWSDGDFMPSKYLLDLFVMPGGSLDPRYSLSFQTIWTANKNYTWTADALKQFDRASSITTSTSVSSGQTAIRFVRPEENDYATGVSTKLAQKYIWVDMADVYGNNGAVKMKYTRVNIDPREADNPFLKFYPSLTKFNNGSLISPKANNYTSDAYSVVMRMGEVYLIAAEAAFYLNGSSQKAVDYINALRTRVYGSGKGQIAAGDITLQFILDERARELCGEYSRWYDLKRTGKLTKSYLSATNPDVGQYFIDGVHRLRPIPQGQLDAMTNTAGFQNPGY